MTKKEKKEGRIGGRSQKEEEKIKTTKRGGRSLKERREKKIEEREESPKSISNGDLLFRLKFG